MPEAALENHEMTHHSVWFERDVRRIDFVVIFFQWTQNWTALNFEVNFQPLIQPYSSRLINNFCRGGWALLSVSKLERQRTSGTQKRSKSDFMYCRKVPFWPARNLGKEFCENVFNHRWSHCLIDAAVKCLFANRHNFRARWKLKCVPKMLRRRKK